MNRHAQRIPDSTVESKTTFTCTNRVEVANMPDEHEAIMRCATILASDALALSREAFAIWKRDFPGPYAPDDEGSRKTAEEMAGMLDFMRSTIADEFTHLCMPQDEKVLKHEQGVNKS